MRNLKRVLSLLMAAAMLIGMMVISAGAVGTYEDFTDKGEIQNKEAVSTLVTLGVFEGTEKGTFEPARTVTRAEMAKIIAVCLNGGRDPLMGTTANTQFADVGDNYNWAKPYINYCATLGIIAGRGDGNFGPGDEVTCEEAAKMFLCALGYDAEKEGFVGVGWNHGVNVKANQVGLYKDLPDGLSLSEGLSRDNTALLTYNGVYTPMVRYNNNGVAEERVNSYVANGNTVTEKITMLDDTFKVEKDSGTADDFGRPGKTWTYNGKEVGFTADAPIATFTSTFSKRDLYNALGRSVVQNLDADGSNVNDYKLTYKLDGNDATNISGYELEDGVNHLLNDRAETAKDLGDNGLLVEIYTTPGEGTTPGMVTIVMINTYLAQVSGDYNTSREQLSIATTQPDNSSYTLSLDDFANLDSFQDKDWVLVTMAGGKVKTIELAETVEGAVDSYTLNNRVTVEGTSYNYSVNRDTGKIPAGYAYEIGSDVILILDAYGYVIGLDSVAGSSNYVFLSAFDSTGNSFSATYQANARFTDGIKETITINQVNGRDITGTSYSASDGGTVTTSGGTYYAGWYTYTTTGDGKYNVTVAENPVANSTTATNAPVTLSNNANVTEHGKAAIRWGGGSINGNNSTVFLVMQGNDLNVYTGVRNVPTIKTHASAASTAKVWAVKANASSNYATYVYIDCGNSGVTDTGTESGDQIFILSDSPSISGSGSSRRWTYEAIVNGEYGDDVTAVATASGTFASRGLYRAVKYNADGDVTGATLVNDASNDNNKKWSVTDATITYSNGTMTFSNGVSDALVLDDDCGILLIEGTNITAMSGNSLANRYSSTGMASLTGNVYASLRSGVVSNLYVDVTGVGTVPPTELSGSPSASAVNNALAGSKPVIVAAGTTLPAGVTVPANKTLTLSGNATVNNLTVAGSVVANGDITGNVTVEAGGSLEAKGDVTGTLTVKGEAVLKEDIDGSVALDATGTLTLSENVATIPLVTGTGHVVISKELVGSITFGGITSTPATAAAGSTATAGAGLKMSGDKKVTGFSSVYTIDELAGRTGSTTVTPYLLTMTGADAGTLTGVLTKKDNTEVPCVFATGESLAVTKAATSADDDNHAISSTGVLEMSVTIGDNVKSVAYTITKSDASTLTWTFNF